jgi:uncharacterized protein (DUF2235 family)
VSKKIVLFSDGTGNSSAKAQKTNVWRLFQALDQTTVEQIAKYDNGVGTSSNKYLAAIGGAFGFGLKRNVLDLYRFVCRNWEQGDQIYGFGFSRGSFTIRVLVDLIAKEGLITSRSEEELARNAAAAYRHYRSKNFPSWSPLVVGMRWLRDGLIWARDWVTGHLTYKQIAEQTEQAKRAEIPIRFLGLWDTVEAYGMPIAELKRGIDWVLWPMLFGDLILSPRVQRACHALSLDDQRTTFHPLLWDEVAEADMVAQHKVAAGRITQIWFAGVHSNVGGGYPEDQLSLVSLEWMMNEAIANGLALEKNAITQVSGTKSPYARLYDSRAGFGSYYRYAPRQIDVRQDGHGNRILPIIHGSAVMRMAYGSDQYAPISLPHEFWVLAPDGELLPMEGSPLSLKMDATKTRAASARPAMIANDAVLSDKTKLTAAITELARPDREAVRLVWDTVFWRQCLYFLTLGLTFVLAVYPWLGGMFTKFAHAIIRYIPVIGFDLDDRWTAWMERIDDGSRGPIRSLLDAVGAFIPGYAQSWTDAFEKHPIEFGMIGGTIIVSLMLSTVLQGRIHDRARLAWHKNVRKDYAEWLTESQRGWRNGMLLALGASLLALITAYIVGKHQLIKLEVELGIVVAGLIALLGLHNIGSREVSGSEKTRVPKTWALSMARFLRNNPVLRGIHKWLFERIVSIGFALLLVIAGLCIFNRALFDGASAAGFFCKGSIDANVRNEERLGRKDGFRTDEMCWPSGFVLKQGHHYRLTLSTPGDWFDRTTRADVAGFPVDNFRHAVATPLKRWLGQNWFKPIVRIGDIGNDEYVLQPAEPLEAYDYPACPNIPRTTIGSGARAKIREDVAQALLACALTPEQRRSVVAEVKARTTGELFLYVNDAVLMWPRSSDQFFSNNTGTGSISVELVVK